MKDNEEKWAEWFVKTCVKVMAMKVSDPDKAQIMSFVATAQNMGFDMGAEATVKEGIQGTLTITDEFKNQSEQMLIEAFSLKEEQKSLSSSRRQEDDKCNHEQIKLSDDNGRWCYRCVKCGGIMG